MPSSATIKDVSVATIRGQLPAPVIFGDWVMKQREFVAVRMRTAGHRGLGLHADARRRLRRADPQGDRAGLCRHRHRRPREDLQDRQGHGPTARTAPASACARCRMVDLAAWDIAAKLADKSDRRISGRQGEADAGHRHHRLSAGAHAAGEDRRAGARALRPTGGGASRRRWASTLEESAERACGRPARRRPTPGSAPTWSGCSRPSTRPPPMPNTIADLDLGCIEDIFPPGNAGKLAELRKRVTMPIWQGDEQGGSYYPEALIMAKSVDRGARRPDLHGRHHRRPARSSTNALPPASISARTCSRMCTARCSAPGASTTGRSNGACRGPASTPMPTASSTAGDRRRTG